MHKIADQWVPIQCVSHQRIPLDRASLSWVSFWVALGAQTLMSHAISPVLLLSVASTMVIGPIVVLVDVD